MRRLAIAAAGLVAGALAAFFLLTASTSAEAGSHYDRQGVYAYGGNRFIIRELRRGDRVDMALYRLAGDQWERQGGTTTSVSRLRAARSGRAGGLDMIEEIYVHGHYLGQSDVDLDNPLNTDLNRGGNTFF